MEKSELRQSYLSRQKAISKQDRAAKSEAIYRLLFQSFDLKQVIYFHCFLPIEKFNEVDTSLIIENVWREYPNIQVLVPRVNFETGAIENLRFEPDTELTKNAWHINEPTHDEFIESELIDMVLVPGLCFDLGGHRVGYGKGFYDRFLKTCRRDCLKVGLGYFEPVDRIDDVHDGDFALDFVVAPDRVYRSVLGCGDANR